MSLHACGKSSILDVNSKLVASSLWYSSCDCGSQNVGQLPEYLEDGIKTAYKRYITYLDSFSPDETYLRKKVETELGTKMIHLKMRCSGIGSEWGKVTFLFALIILLYFMNQNIAIFMH